MTKFWKLFLHGPLALAGLLACGLGEVRSGDHPAGPTVSQGSASFSTQGSQFTIQTSDRAAINW